MKTIITWTAAFVTLSALAFAAAPQTINYQGYLKDSSTGAPVSGTVNVTFKLYSSGSGLNPLWSGTPQSVTPQNGIYNTQIGPTSLLFDRQYWLGVDVDGAKLVPLQKLEAAPYALRAVVADSAATGSIGTVSLADSSVTDAKISGTISASKLSGVWKKSGNTGTTPGTDFLGTTDNLPFEIRVNNQRIALFQPDATSPNIALGSSANTAGGAGIYGTTVSGGGNTSSNCYNPVSGLNDRACANSASGLYNTVGGGYSNMASGYNMSTVGGGAVNTASGNYSTIGGGYSNTAGGNANTVGGGNFNTVGGSAGTVGGGVANTVSGNFGAVGGGPPIQQVEIIA